MKGGKNSAIRIIMDKGKVNYNNNFLLINQSNHLYEEMQKSIEWAQHPIKMFGKTHMQPRLIAFQGEEGIRYKYSGTSLEASEWTEEVQIIKKKVEEESGMQFNSVLINYYRNGSDSMGWHSDDEKELGISPVIASVSLGVSREIQFRKKENKKEKKKILLEPGSLLMMYGETQKYWQHQIAKKKGVEGGRINLTFRSVL
jgi:alkylated DNA repair dioxygenase AlkB